ncbi:MAG: class I SAM-dependent methyltransferase [Pseudomonadota bacterium]
MKQTSDTSFEPDWLSLREPADHAARDASLLKRAGAEFAAGTTVLDLGSGTGSTARAFAAAGFSDLNWRFYDQDRALLKIAEEQFPNADCITGDIADIENLSFDDVGLITASALFDLMSEDWITSFIVRAEKFTTPIYAALNYNGVMRWTPGDPEDAEITEAFNAHQRRDKGTGAALGPTAATTFARIAKARGWHVATAESPWQLGPENGPLRAKLLVGIATAAEETGARNALSWHARRSGMATSNLWVGHIDVLAIPGAAT